MTVVTPYKKMDAFLEITMLQLLRTNPCSIDHKSFTDWMKLPKNDSLSSFVNFEDFYSRKILVYTILRYENDTPCEELLDLLNELKY